MSILDVLKSASGKQQGAPDIPTGGGYSAKDVKTAQNMAKTLSSIEKMLKQSNKHWDKMAQARPLDKALKSMKAFEKQQAIHNRLMRQGNVQMDSRIRSYEKLAKSRKQAIDDTKEYNKRLNETKGMAGRTLNVLNEMPGTMTLIAAAVRDAGIVLGDMNQGFDVMARTSGVASQSMGELAKSTGNYMVQMKMGSVVAAQFGITAEDSNMAFAKLTETYGGTGEAVDMMADKWSGMAAIAKLSGLGMADVANLADQGFKKLGETLDDTLNTVTLMSQTTAELNARFGKGSVNTRQFAAAIQEMAYGASFMNQNSRMLTETLGRELQMQLALGKAPEAAVKAAQKNMELAGKVNIIGITKFRDAMQKEYDAIKDPKERAAHLKNLADEFGSEGEIIANMLETKTLMSSNNLFAFEKAVQNSSKLGAEMLDNMRDSAATGDVGALLSLGLSIGDAQYMIAEANTLATKIKKLKTGGEEAAESLFGEGWRSDPETKKFVDEAIKTGPGAKTTRELARDFRKMPGATEKMAALAKEAKGLEPWEKFRLDGEGAGWFGGITNSFATITSLLGTLPISLGAVIGALMLRKSLAAGLRNKALPGMGRAMPSLARGARGLGSMGGRAMGAMGGMAGMASAASVGMVLKMAYGWYDGFQRAGEIFGKLEANVTPLERAAAMAAAGVEQLTFGFLGSAEDLAKGATKWQEWFYDSFFKPFEGGGISAGAGLFTGIGDWAADKIYGTSAAPTPPPTAPKAPTPMADTVTDAGTAGSGGGAAVATGSVSGNSLILEVTNWDTIYAQSVHAAS